MTREIYPVRTFILTLRITETPTGVPADVRLAHVLKYAGRVQGFKCISSAETTPPLKDYEIEALKKEGKLLNAKETQK